MLSLIQNHTRVIYNLEEKEYKIKRISARSLLLPQRFDLFAKLYYINNRELDNDKAIKVYKEHIKAFNPDWKEPGRTDKSSFEDFIKIFNNLIEYFKDNEFNDEVSIIPVDEDGIILDGAHRVAALAFYNKEVTIAQFDKVKSKAIFDYEYFKNRGLQWAIADIIALEMIRWIPNIYVACLWPKLDDRSKSIARSKIKENNIISYDKDININLSSLSSFISSIYKAQEWTHSKAAVDDKAIRCYGRSKTIELVFFYSQRLLPEIINEKEEIRKLFMLEKDSLHITDTTKETVEIAELVLNKSILEQWNVYEKRELSKFINIIKEKWFIFKKVHWINIKVFIAKLIK